uniref:reverse transcriptase intron maturase and HNH endonuclease n=1 Tax=Hydrocytium acuminatum TaxID=1745963 RepID=UPI002A83C2E0|nr:reverse transcriptase intron maturase and HNH endonuclease [Hydrocytium acuminatum]WOR09536.1 reverse transcriptase intron maturase and HNH endonuclease [Hydrocytium acuminatum]
MKSHMSKLYNNLAWNTVNWAKVRKRVTRLQNRIFKAKGKGLTDTVVGLQIKLINSLDARLLSVLQVTTYNKGSKTAADADAAADGVDRQIVTKSETKLKMALRLRLDGKAKPIRRVWIPKPGKIEKRPLGIPTIMDRAKQQLALFALEPEWEAVFEPNSYGFRKGRSCHDAIEAIFLCLRHKRTKYVFDADISKCFDKIDHTVLLRKLNTFPQLQRQIEAWLKAGIMEVYANKTKSYNSISRNDIDTSQGGIISPLLANVALHGLEEHLKEFCANKIDKKVFNTGSKKRRKSACGVIRYADDFVVIHENKEVLELCIAQVKSWLMTVGLEMSEEKSKLQSAADAKDARNGFNFLGFQIILVKRGRALNHPYKVKIVPAKANCLRFLSKVRTVITRAKAWSSYDLIRVLKPIFIGWANYYRFSECKNTFSKMYYMIFGMLRAWAFRRDTRNGRLNIKQKYFPSGNTYVFHGRSYKDNWTLVGQNKQKDGIKVHNFLPHLNWVESSKHVKIKGNKSPFDGDSIYWAKRLAKYSNFSNSMVKIMKFQNFKCTICNEFFILGERLEIDHIIPKSQGGNNNFKNLQLLHRICHVGKTHDQNVSLINIRDLKRRKESEMQICSQDSLEDIYASDSED